ncbi:signal-regulatory protein beta-2-like [Mastacembelus armatus]|uniref:signal-regulatory protein beta-2-like n=1 Tax=Mastacembelus armatus TaxID=205130 RepID=UPI000E45A625|nr:signal-regulatory protein beta-2-like [Mastacembelus armatus]
MLIIFHLLLLLRVKRCTGDLSFVTKTVEVGDEVTLTCTRQTSDYDAMFYWIRLVSGNFPEFLGGTFSFNYDGVTTTPHITTKQGPGSFFLHINEIKPSDAGVYYCIKVDLLDMKFLNGTFLRFKGPKPEITSALHIAPSDPVRPGDSVTLQCSVLSDSEVKMCPANHSVYWFRAGSDDSHPSVIYAHGNSGDQCERSPEVPSLQKCVYNFSKNISSSDAGTYYCAVATCGQIYFGNGTKLDIEETNMWSQTASPIIFLLSGVSSLIVIACLICAIKRNSCDYCKVAAALHKNSQKSQQNNEDTWAYSAAIFTVMRTGSGAIKKVQTAERETGSLLQ